MSVPNVRDLFPDLLARNIEAHRATREMASGTSSGGHDPMHDISVAQMTLVLGWQDNPTQARLACAAGLCHSIDWILKRQSQIKSSIEGVNDPNVPLDEIERVMRVWLKECTDIREQDLELVVQAAVHHGGKPNAPDDPLVFVLLTDADRLENIGATVLIRGGQHHVNSMVVDPVHFEKEPGATYASHKTVLWDLWNCTTWMADEGPYIIRLPQAREIGQKRVNRLLKFIGDVKEDINELGLSQEDWVEILKLLGI